MSATLEKDIYVQTFDRLAPTLAGAGVAWLDDLRVTSLERYSKNGFPTSKLEAWRFTPVEPLAQASYPYPSPSSKIGLSAAQLKSLSFGLSGPTLVFVDGWYRPELSRVPANAGFRLAPLSQLFASNGTDLEKRLASLSRPGEQSLTDLNTALFADAAHLYVPAGVTVEAPIQLLFIALTAGTQSHPRVLIALEKGSQATVIEQFIGADSDGGFSNGVAEIALADGARLAHYKLVRPSPSASQVTTTYVHQARDSQYQSHVFLQGGALIRNNIDVVLDGEGAECTLNGLYRVTGHQVADSHTRIDHVKPHGTSHQLYKGVLDESAQAVFDGAVIVRGEAQKTDSAQTNKNLLLSDKAKVNTKPELKIFANDVKCKHGATIGQIDPVSLFYLRSRGVPAAQARQLLIRAFANDMIERVEVPALREALGAQLEGPHV